MNPNSAPVSPDPSVNIALPSPRIRELNTLRDLFKIELDRFTAIDLSVRIQHNVDLYTLLWNTFGQEIKRLGKDFDVLETYSNELQLNIIEWFLVRVHGSIEEINLEEGHKWTKAVSIYFDTLCLDEYESKLESPELS